jgi:NADH:ubiquinone oxidoreductase subunit
MAEKNARRLIFFSLLFFVVVKSRIREGKNQDQEKNIPDPQHCFYPKKFCSIQVKSCVEYDSRRCSSCPGEDTRRNNRQTSAASAIPPQYSGCIPYPVQRQNKTRQIKIRESFFLRPEKQKNTGKT